MVRGAFSTTSTRVRCSLVYGTAASLLHSMENPSLSGDDEQPPSAGRISKDNAKVDHAQTSSDCTVSLTSLVQAGWCLGEER